LSIRIHNTGSVSVFYLLFGCTLRLRWDWTRRMLLRQLSTYAANILSARFSSFVSGTGTGTAQAFCAHYIWFLMRILACSFCVRYSI
jgi:hypothetical protein